MPERETRAPTTTLANFESFICGDIAMLSSSVNSNGSSATVRFRIASGMRGPSAARAKMKTVSVGSARAASAGARLTRPRMRAASAGAEADWIGVWAVCAVCVDCDGGEASLPAPPFAPPSSLKLRSSPAANSLPDGAWPSACCQ